MHVRRPIVLYVTVSLTAPPSSRAKGRVAELVSELFWAGEIGLGS